MVTYEFSGKYVLHVTDGLRENDAHGNGAYPQWKTNPNGVKTNNYKYPLHPRLVKAILNKVNDMDVINMNGSYFVEG